MAFANTGRMRPSVLFIGGFERKRSFFHENSVKSMCAISSRTISGADDCQMIVNALASARVPFEKTNDGPAPAQVCSEF